MQSSHDFSQKVNLFMSFIQVADSTNLESTVTSFLSQSEDNSTKQVVYDRGQLMMIDDGKLVREITASARSMRDRIVSFDGRRIIEINPYSYLNSRTIQMKGDTSRRRTRSSSTSSGSSTSTNNNNNNNNNG